MKKLILLVLLLVSFSLPYSTMAMEAPKLEDEYIEADVINRYTAQDKSDTAILVTVSIVFVGIIIGFGIVEYKIKHRME